MGTIALATDFRITETTSPSKNIRTECPASERASPCRNGNADFVGSSDPQALSIMMLRDLLVDGWLHAVKPRKRQSDHLRQKLSPGHGNLLIFA